VQRDMRAERLDDLQKLKDRGVVSNNTVIVLRTELADIEARREEYAVAVIQAESRLTLAERAKTSFTSDEEEALAKNIAAVDQEIADARSALDASQALATILVNRRGQIAQSYQILRQTKDGATSLAATEVTALKPGDVLKVEVDKVEPSTAVTKPLRGRATPIVQQEAKR
jgi:exopolysaccharide production protein ExoF